LEVLTGAAVSYLATDEQNAAAVRALAPGMLGGTGAPGPAPPAPPIPPDLRAPMPPPAPMAPAAISAAVHSGSPEEGEAFIGAWSQVADAGRDGAATLRSAVAALPEVLDGPMSTPAVTRHLLGFADGLDAYAERAATLVLQAKAYAGNQIQVRAEIPTPQQLANAENNVRTLAAANAASGGKHAAALARAVSVNNQLNEQAMSGYPPYHTRTDADTAGEDPGGDGQQMAPGDPATGDAGGQGPAAAATPGASAADPAADGVSGQLGAEMASLLPQLLGAAGGMLGQAVGAVTNAPETLLQAGEQALSSATSGLSGLGHPKSDPGGGGPPEPGGAGGDPAGGGAGDAATTPAGGDGAPDLPVAPSTGAPPAPAIAPVGAAENAAAGGAPAGPGGMPMGMPMGGLGGAPGAAGDKEKPGPTRKIAVPDIPHTEDITGRTDTSRLSAAAAAHRDRPQADGDDPTDPPAPVVRRLVTRAPKDQS